MSDEKKEPIIEDGSEKAEDCEKRLGDMTEEELDCLAGGAGSCPSGYVLRKGRCVRLLVK